MKVIDIIFIIILLFGAYRGFRSGLFLEIVGFFAFIFAILTAFKLLNTGIAFIKDNWETDTILLPYISFILIFCLVFFAIHLLSKGLKKIMDYTLLGKADNFAGALLGILKFSFAVSVLLWLTRAASIEFPPSVIQESFLYDPLVEFAPQVVYYVGYIIPIQDIFPAIQGLLTPANV